MEPVKKSVNLSLLKSLSILELFNLEYYELSITIIANKLNFPISTTHRLLSTLESAGYIRQNPENGKYSLGLSCFLLGNYVHYYRELSFQARPHLLHLSSLHNETTNMVVSNGDGFVVCIERAKANRGLFAHSEIGTRHKIHLSSCGKAILAFISAQQQDELIAKVNFTPQTPKSITSKYDLHRELISIREKGYAIENDESEIGLFCCGAPIFSNTGACIAAISISMPSSRMNYPSEQLQNDIKETALAISVDLGYKPAIKS